MESNFHNVLCSVLWGNQGEKRGNFYETNMIYNDCMGTNKKARRLGNYCIRTVFTYLLALALILVEMRGVEPLSRSVAI